MSRLNNPNCDDTRLGRPREKPWARSPAVRVVARWTTPEIAVGSWTQSLEKSEFDLFNLRHSAGEGDDDRSNWRYGEIAGGDRAGTCDVEVDFSNDLAEPAPAVRANAARVSMYIDETCRLWLSREEMEMHLRWDDSDSVDAAEQDLAKARPL